VTKHLREIFDYQITAGHMACNHVSCSHHYFMPIVTLGMMMALTPIDQFLPTEVFALTLRV